MWNNKYSVDTHSFSPLNKNRGVPQIDSDCNIYTDGSKQDSGLSGAGVAVFKCLRQFFETRESKHEYPIHDQSFHLKESSALKINVGI